MDNQVFGQFHPMVNPIKSKEPLDHRQHQRPTKMPLNVDFVLDHHLLEEKEQTNVFSRSTLWTYQFHNWVHWKTDWNNCMYNYSIDHCKFLHVDMVMINIHRFVDHNLHQYNRAHKDKVLVQHLNNIVHHFDMYYLYHMVLKKERWIYFREVFSTNLDIHR